MVPHSPPLNHSPPLTPPVKRHCFLPLMARYSLLLKLRHWVRLMPRRQYWLTYLPRRRMPQSTSAKVR